MKSRWRQGAHDGKLLSVLKMCLYLNMFLRILMLYKTKQTLFNLVRYGEHRAFQAFAELIGIIEV